jgi:hypothetical protein
MPFGNEEAKSPQSADIEPGDIIRVRDLHDLGNNLSFESRLHNRIFLVIRTNYDSGIPSLTCLGFCQHDAKVNLTVSPQFAASHVRVKCAHTGEGTKTTTEGLSHLKVTLGRPNLTRSSNPSTHVTPQPDVWLNIREHWNLDAQLGVIVLGQADDESFQEIAEQVVDLFGKTVLGGLVQKGKKRGADDTVSRDDSRRKKKERKYESGWRK